MWAHLPLFVPLLKANTISRCRPQVLPKLAWGCARCLPSMRRLPHRGLVFKSVLFTSVCCHVSPVKRRKFSWNVPPFFCESQPAIYMPSGGTVAVLLFRWSGGPLVQSQSSELIKRINLKTTLELLLPMSVFSLLWQMEHFVIILGTTKYFLSERSRFLSDCRLKMITHNYSVMLSALFSWSTFKEVCVCVYHLLWHLTLHTHTPFKGL